MSESAEKRLYKAVPMKDGEPDPDQKLRIVDAQNPAQVYQHLARHGWAVETINPREVAAAVKDGVDIEDAATKSRA
ncbi:MAG: hypothetical protein HY749_16070 [Gammaproteobacteria bacterium]|nr:hypothetical protein [Gammaproteobacteria bacterium]